jgi:hypothetical protein
MDYTTKWLRIEGAGILAGALTAYALSGASWLLFAGLLLLPDLAMAGYLFGPRVGAASYNLIHLYVWPALLFVLFAAGAAPWTLTVALVWTAHIAMDRALGYGLKRPSSFHDTHLGPIGAERSKAPTPAVRSS